MMTTDVYRFCLANLPHLAGHCPFRADSSFMYHLPSPLPATARRWTPFWVGSLAMRATAFKRELLPEDAAPHQAEPVPFCTLAAHVLPTPGTNPFIEPQQTTQADTDWPPQMTIEGVCALKKSHVAVLRRSHPVQLHVLAAAAPPTPLASAAAAEPQTYLAALVGQLQANMQAAVVRLDGQRTLLIMPAGKALMGFVVTPSSVPEYFPERPTSEAILRTAQGEESHEVGSTDLNLPCRGSNKKRPHEAVSSRQRRAAEAKCTSKRRMLTPPEEQDEPP